MSETENTGKIVHVLRSSPNLVRASIAGLLFLLFCFFIWDHFFREDDPCHRLSTDICERLKPHILRCQETTRMQRSYQDRCDDADPSDTECDQLQRKIDITEEQCAQILAKQSNCAQSKQALIESGRASAGSCTHALDMMRGLWAR